MRNFYIFPKHHENGCEPQDHRKPSGPAKGVKRAAAIGLSAAVVLSMAACGSSKAGKSSSASSTASDTGSSEDQDSAKSTDDSAKKTSADGMFTERDLEGSYDASEAVKVTLSDDGSSADGDGVTVDGSTVKITEEGVYLLSGTLSNGQIIVEAPDDAKVQIVLDGVNLTCETSAAIYAKTADKVFVTTAEGSENTLATSKTFAADGDIKVDGVIFAKCDLTVNGSGSLNITSTANGIVSKDDLKLTGSTVKIDAQKKGLEANNSVRIADGTYDITSGDDAIHADSSDDEAGFVYISGGILTIDAGDDGIHADGDTTIDGGTITVADSYEGIEGATITINDGDISVTSEDDGLNSAGGSDESDQTGGPMGQDHFRQMSTETTASSDSTDAGTSAAEAAKSGSTTASEGYTMTINGGTVDVNASGDGLDSNGDLYINGGTVTVSGATNNGDGAIDYGEGCEAVITGGTLIATGMSGMAENFSENSSQPVILLGVDETSGAITVTDAGGTELAGYTPPKQYNCVYVSSPDMKTGETYTIRTGDAGTDVEVSSTITSSGNLSGGMGDMGGRGGMRGEMQGKPQMR